MVCFLYKLYYLKFSSLSLDKQYVKTMMFLANLLIPLWYKITGWLPAYSIKDHNSDKRDEYIVSLTSFPDRIHKVWIVIESILRQKHKPDKIILWLYDKEFEGKESLPRKLLGMERRGLHIEFCSKNLMPHLKYYYTMLNHPHSKVITIDDDIIYPVDLLHKLKLYHKRFPEAIVCALVREINYDGHDILPYHTWKNLNRSSVKPNFRYLPLGVGSVLYPAGSLHPDVFNVDKITRLALKTDDLWLKTMSLRNKSQVLSISGEFPRVFIPIRNRKTKNLMDGNLNQGNNDRVMKNLISHYQIPESIFK